MIKCYVNKNCRLQNPLHREYIHYKSFTVQLRHCLISGWGGRGLGAAEQGIVNPIEASDVRDRQDMYKGIGINLKDPFEQFRKNKSQGFIQRMKARDESRDPEGKERRGKSK